MSSFLRRIHGLLLRIARQIGKVNNFLLLFISFYALLLPIALFRRIVVRRQNEKGWLKRSPLPKDHFRKQY